MSDFKRPRGIVTPRQIRGFELMMAGAVQDDLRDGICEVHRDNLVGIVNYDRQECTCKQFVTSHPRTPCYCIWAVRYFVEPPDAEEIETLRRQRAGELLTLEAAQAMRASGLVEAHTVTERDVAEARDIAVRGGYKRFASAYDSVLRDDFGNVMRFALAFFEDAEQVFVWRPIQKRGRRPIRLSRLLFAAYIYARLGWSLRAVEGFLTFLASLGFIDEEYPDFGTLSLFIRSSEAVGLLREVIALSSEPFRDLGPMTLAGDATGAASDRNKFFDYRSQRTDKKEQTRPGRPWFRAHAVCNVDLLNTVAIRITGPTGSEKNMLQKVLVPELEVRDYDIEQFLADGGLNSTMIREDIIEKLGATPYIPWAKNSKNAIPRKWRKLVKNAPLITDLHTLCMTHPEEFKKAGYRYRVKVENLFSAVKEKYGPYVRTIEGSGPENEIMLKFLCMNIHVLMLAAEIYGLDVATRMPSLIAA